MEKLLAARLASVHVHDSSQKGCAKKILSMQVFSVLFPMLI